MFCNKCGTENEDGSKFCSSCGNNLEGVQVKKESVNETEEPVQVEETERKSSLIEKIGIGLGVLFIAGFILNLTSTGGIKSQNDMCKELYPVMNADSKLQGAVQQLHQIQWIENCNNSFDKSFVEQMYKKNMK